MRKRQLDSFLWPFLQFSHKRVNLSCYKSMLVLNTKKNSARVAQNPFEMSQSTAECKNRNYSKCKATALNSHFNCLDASFSLGRIFCAFFSFYLNLHFMENKNIKHGNESSVKVGARTLQIDSAGLQRIAHNLRWEYVARERRNKNKTIQAFFALLQMNAKIPQQRKKRLFPFRLVAAFLRKGF